MPGWLGGKAEIAVQVELPET